jgi:2-oxoglutarate ferredoxin oxidoreductase subunit alpha
MGVTIVGVCATRRNWPPVTEVRSQSMRELITGAEAIVRGAIHAGCDFFAGYPITPATQILLLMTRELPKVGGIAIQGEDEIASIGFCIGAAMAGARPMTATSGPGISLYSENIGLAIMTEIPLVIVDVQRMGPATGGATTTAQGDVQFLRWGTSGGYPLIVLAPTTPADCYTLTMKAFDLAERFRLPVILATDKEINLASSTVESSAFQPLPIRQRAMAPSSVSYLPYGAELPSGVPLMAHMGGEHLVRFSTSSHNEQGYLTKDAAAMKRLNERLAAKVDAHVDEITMLDLDLQPQAETLIISYGITARSSLEAVRRARAAGERLSAVTVYSLWPIPEAALRQAMQDVKRIIVPELNLGQYRREVERLARDDQEVLGVNRVDGELILPQAILAKGGLA